MAHAPRDRQNFLLKAQLNCGRQKTDSSMDSGFRPDLGKKGDPRILDYPECPRQTRAELRNGETIGLISIADNRGEGCKKGPDLDRPLYISRSSPYPRRLHRIPLLVTLSMPLFSTDHHDRSLTLHPRCNRAYVPPAAVYAASLIRGVEEERRGPVAQGADRAGVQVVRAATGLEERAVKDGLRGLLFGDSVDRGGDNEFFMRLELCGHGAHDAWVLCGHGMAHVPALDARTWPEGTNLGWVTDQEVFSGNFGMGDRPGSLSRMRASARTVTLAHVLPRPSLVLLAYTRAALYPIHPQRFFSVPEDEEWRWRPRTARFSHPSTLSQLQRGRGVCGTHRGGSKSPRPVSPERVVFDVML
ncbi:hypothetical protein HU200_021659 [Digitaria exilis]|uniref:Uncharacterized protein n=1 Tax=Digitaria exilis TaxID=1010633 RepID=A0A835KDH9_9POAL|nr:hypothetical protein HU200_021659 [Digitaria exilis]